MDTPTLFLCVMDDLGALIKETTEYSLLRLAGILRLLLLDGEPLVHQANRGPRLRLMFEVAQTLDTIPGNPAGVAPAVSSVEDGFDPETCPPWVERRLLPLAQFLGTGVLLVQGHRHDVADMIRQVAHVNGVVHAGVPENDKQRAFRDLEGGVYLGGAPFGARALRAIGRVTYRALLPLAQAIEPGYPGEPEGSSA